MSEERVIRQTPELPATVDSLSADLTDLGVRKGDVLLVHASLSSLGWVCGGAVSVIQAMQKAVGDNGTIVMPSFTSNLSEPSLWSNPPVPESWWPIVRSELPPFDPLTTPSCGVGAIAECFRTIPSVCRSNHPHVSFAASGPVAHQIVASHQIEDGLGDSSPLGKLYDMGARIVLLGVEFDRCTALHLAEIRSETRSDIATGAPVIIDGQRKWVTFSEPEFHDARFCEIGEAFASQESCMQSRGVACATAMLIPLRELVDFAETIFRTKG